MSQMFFSGIRDNQSRGNVLDFLKNHIHEESSLSFVSAFFTIYAYDKLKTELESIENLRFLFGEPRFLQSLDPEKTDKKSFNIEDNELSLANRLEQSKIAKNCQKWIENKVEIRSIKKPNFLHGKLFHIQHSNNMEHAILGSSNFTVNGIGAGNSPNIELNLLIDSNRDRSDLLQWFNEIWNSENVEDVKEEVINYLKQLYLDYSPEFIYYKTLFHLFYKFLLDKSALDTLENQTHFFDTLIWKALYEFQKDGVKAAINKIEKHNGCIIADSVGLGKTFEALAIIKYFELRNDKVLVLCPKKLRENWTTYQVTNHSALNPFIDDKFGYMVLNHTDLRDTGKQGDINLSTINWGNFDLVVIDESHNFRNNTKGKLDEEGNTIRKSRYEKLMEDIIKSGRKTKVLLLSATPVNVNLKDLRNQIYFLTADKDNVFSDTIGINSIHQTLKQSQTVFSAWADPKKQTERVTAELIERLPSSFFKMLDELTLARSRKHIRKYYKDTLKELGDFPKRKKPISLSSAIDLEDEFVSYDYLNERISEYNLSLFTPFKYLKPEKVQVYEKKVNPRMIKNFTQEKREFFLIGMMKMNFMKRLESSIHSFKLTLENTIAKIKDIEKKIKDYKAHKKESHSIESDELEMHTEDEEVNSAFEIGEKLIYKLEDIEVDRWLEDLKKDRNSLQYILNTAKVVLPERDAKLKDLKDLITKKIQNPTKNKDGKDNRKVLIFTAFSDTASYLYNNLNEYVKNELSVHIALVVGSGTNKTTLGKTIYNDILTNFSPISKNRDKINGMPLEEIDVLIATDCISEGQNLQDCDYLINYDIHWNPVRVIQRFGRIDRLGSRNKAVHLINFWPTKELDNYIRLKHRVEARMALVDIAATNEDNILNVDEIEEIVKDDLSYRDEQLKKLKEEILDLDDVFDNISFSEFTLDDFRVDLMSYLQSNEKILREAPLGLYSLVPSSIELENTISSVAKGVIFCFKHKADSKSTESINPLQPYYLVYIQDDGNVRYKFTHAKQILDIYRALCVGKTTPIEDLCKEFNQETKDGKDMEIYNKLLKVSIDAIAKVFKKRSMSLLTSSRNSILPPKKEQARETDDFELVTWLVIK